MPKNSIELIARGVLIDSGDRVLVCCNIEGGYCYLPGGHIDPGEPAAAALVREFREETALQVVCTDLLAASENAFTHDQRLVHELNLVFRVECLGEVPAEVISQEAKIAFRWIERAGLTDADARPSGLMSWLSGAKLDRSTWITEMAQK